MSDWLTTKVFLRCWCISFETSRTTMTQKTFAKQWLIYNKSRKWYRIVDILFDIKNTFLQRKPLLIPEKSSPRHSILIESSISITNRMISTKNLTNRISHGTTLRVVIRTQFCLLVPSHTRNYKLETNHLFSSNSLNALRVHMSAIIMEWVSVNSVLFIWRVILSTDWATSKITARFSRGMNFHLGGAISGESYYRIAVNKSIREPTDERPTRVFCI